MKEAKRNWLGLGKHQKGSFFFSQLCRFASRPRLLKKNSVEN